VKKFLSFRNFQILGKRVRKKIKHFGDEEFLYGKNKPKSRKIKRKKETKNKG
jgi:hypothetical protein